MFTFIPSLAEFDTAAEQVYEDEDEVEELDPIEGANGRGGIQQ